MMDTIKKYLKTIGKGFFNSLFERSIRVYIQKHLGEFLLEKLTTDQVDIGLDGGSLASLILNCEAINERLEGVNIPFTLLKGCIGILHLKIPWSEISTESIIVEVEGLELVLKPKETEIDDGIDVKSVLESMTASMVEEVMKNNVAAEDITKISEAGKGASPFESVEIMSQFISSITSRIQVTMTNVIIRTEKSPGVCVELTIEKLEYYDKDCIPSSVPGKEKNPTVQNAVKGFTTKVVEINKVKLSVEEVWSRPTSPKSLDPIQQSTIAFDIAMSSPPNSGSYMTSSCMTQSIYPGMSSLDKDTSVDDTEPEGGGMIPIVSLDKTQTITIQIKNDDQLPGPAVEVSWVTESLHMFMSPKLLNLITQFLNSSESKKVAKSVPMTQEDYLVCNRLQEAEDPTYRNSNLFRVPDLTLEKHMEVMHGATAESLLSEDDMFYSAYPSGQKSSVSVFDVSDSASVSTFTADSSYSNFNASEFSYTKKHRIPERSISRQWDDNMAETVKVNLIVPFFTVSLLLEDPDPVSGIPMTMDSANAPLNPVSAKTGYSGPVQSFSSFSPPKSFTGTKKLSEQTDSASFLFSESGMDQSHLSFKTARYDSDEDDDDNEEYHDSGEYLTSSVDGQDIKQPGTIPHHISEFFKKQINSCSKSSPTSTSTSENQLQTIAVGLFEKLYKLDSHSQLHILRDEVAAILPLDHIGLLAKPVHVSVMQEKRASSTKLNANVTFGKLEVTECLFDCISKPSDFAKTALPKLPQYTVKKGQTTTFKQIQKNQLLAFDVNGHSESTVPYDPFNVFHSERTKTTQSALTVTIDSVQSKRHGRDIPAVKVKLDFNSMMSEVDVTIIDRLTNLIHRDPFSGSGTSLGAHLMDTNGQVGIEEAIKDENNGKKLNLDIQAKAVHATLRVRFPIPDLRVDRPSHTRDWWRRNLHKEVLLLKMDSPEAGTNIRTDEPWQLELQIFKITAYLQEDINEEPILFGEVTVEDPKATAHDGHHFNWPRIVINVSNKANSALETEEESDASATSIDSYMEPGMLKRESGPFSKKKSLYERDDLSFNQNNPVNDEMVMPGDTNELRQFREECLAHTGLSVDITVPSVTAFLHSRDFLELIYNRFNNDLLMWEPQPPRKHTYLTSMIPSNTSLGVLHMLQNVMGDLEDKSKTNSDDENSDSEDDESMHYSIHDHKYSNKPVKNVSPKLLNKLCFSLSIGSGSLLAVVPHQDKSTPDLHGEILITLKDGLLFTVNEHGGDPDLKYLCLQANKAYMYHNAHLLHSVKPGNLDHIRNRIPDYLKSKIYRSERWVSDKSQGRAGWGQDSPDMVTLVVKTKIDTLNNVKNFTLALRVDGATLRHEMHRPGESWISQTIDLFDLKDFPILGYTLPKIMTEIHLQIDHCCVDYRPINLPIWTFLTVEHFNICSNIIAESAFSQIRLSLDDSALFVSKKCNKEVNLLKDYVCIAEIDQFKIWLQFCYDKKGYQRAPKSDLRFMVNELNLYTCADSTKALLDLIQYIVNDGDLEERGDAGDITPTACEELPPLISNEEPSSSPVIQNITPEQVASVEAALEEAMIDCPETQKMKHQSGKKEKPQRMTTVFFQCDNSKHMPSMKDDIDRALLQITISDSSDSTTPDEEGASGDMEDFEIVDCHFKEVTNIKGSHEVHMLTPKPIEVNENFLRKPTSSYDHLKAPEKFPDPEAQYTLREMSVVWHIYGGSDFSHPRRGSSSERKSHSKGIPSPRELRKSESGSKTRRHSWRHRGGDFRDFNVLMELDLNKIRFRYDVYPNHTKQASRFKLLVNNIEVRDRIKSSEVNKLLVKLVDKEHPEQSSAYMLMFSGVFTRPEYLPFRKECEVKAFCLPIKLNIDQVSLNFLWKFIAQVSEPEVESLLESGGRSSPLGGRSSPAPSSPRSSITSSDPIMRVGSLSTSETSMDQTELLMKFEDFTNQQSLYLQARLNENLNLEIPEEDLPVFIKSFILISDVTIKLDYRGKRCDMDSGMVGMMLGVASLTGSMVKLKRINCQKGILGWDKLLMYAYSEWLNDIRSYQIHSILKGVGSLSIVFQIVQGVMDLIRLPIEQYQKDRRIIRGLQRGANSFTLNTLMAILELTNKVVGSIQYCAEMGYDMMSPGPSVRRRKQLRQNSRQPRTIAEGAKTALTLVTEGVKESASSLSAIVSEESAHKGYVGVVGGALRNAAPECLFKPLALLAEAGTSIVQGVRNEVDPSKMKEEEDRWK